MTTEAMFFRQAEIMTELEIAAAMTAKEFENSIYLKKTFQLFREYIGLARELKDKGIEGEEALEK